MGGKPRKAPTEAKSEALAKRPRLISRKAPNGSRITVTKAGREAIREWSANGLSNTAIAARLGIKRDTLWDIRKRDPDVDDALERGRGELEGELTDILLDKARTGDTAAAIYLTKARCGWRERGDVEASTVNIQVNQFGAMKTPELRERLSELLTLRDHLLGQVDAEPGA